MHRASRIFSGIRGLKRVGEEDIRKAPVAAVVHGVAIG
jgi:hypothetical protein